MDTISRAFLEQFDLWLRTSTVNLPDSELGHCPVCGTWAGEEENIIQCFGSTEDIGISMNSGPFDACSWQELRRCNNPGCDAFFTCESSNY